MTQIAKHTEQTNYRYDSSSWLYKFMYSFFGGFVQTTQYTYDGIWASQSATLSRALTELGSYSWITDGSGNVNQYLAYMPFGEQFINQRIGNDIRFKFTGKERDSETGFDYFGARYYDSDLSIWLSVDPLSDEYPSTSPYMYVRGNPIMLVDPDGMSDTDYGVKKNGEVTQIGPTNNEPDRLYAINDDGTKKSEKHVTVKNKTVLPELAKAKSTVGVADAEGNVHDSKTLRYSLQMNNI